MVKLCMDANIVLSDIKVWLSHISRVCNFVLSVGSVCDFRRFWCRWTYMAKTTFNMFWFWCFEILPKTTRTDIVSGDKNKVLLFYEKIDETLLWACFCFHIFLKLFSISNIKWQIIEFHRHAQEPKWKVQSCKLQQRLLFALLNSFLLNSSTIAIFAKQKMCFSLAYVLSIKINCMFFLFICWIFLKTP